MIAITHLKTIQKSQAYQFSAKDSHSVYSLAEANLTLSMCFPFFIFFDGGAGGMGDLEWVRMN